MIPEAARACGRPCAVHSAPALSATPSARRPQRALSAPSARHALSAAAAGSRNLSAGPDCHTLHHSFLPVLFYNGLKHQGRRLIVTIIEIKKLKV